jgi:GntR family transcriptional regulator
MPEILDKNTPIPLYYQLKEIFREKIDTGELKPGDLVPSERELSEKYTISRPTIRQALKELVNEGLLRREKGRGTFVSEPKINYGFIQKLTTFYDDMVEKGYTMKTKVIKQEIKPISKAMAIKLNIDEDESIIYLARVRYIENEPVVSVVNHIPYKLCPGLIKEELENKSLYQLLTEKYGLKPFKVKISLEPVLASEYDAELLNIEEGDPVHLMKNITYTENNVIMDYFESHFRGDKGKIMVELYK